jgi:ubiquinone/menaquinone biosynthesis C-methylase UbiE
MCSENSTKPSRRSKSRQPQPVPDWRNTILHLESRLANQENAEADCVNEAIKNNYNLTGVAVMQAMYCDEYLSIGGTESTDVLARAAGMSGSTRVLDIGCGVGGPALHLAATYGCHVTGVDLVASSISLAQEKALERELSARTAFEVANATALPFDAATFDVVYGQDAWCHIPDKSALIAQCARVLRPGGVIAFTDWLRVGERADTAAMVALQAALSKDAACVDAYLALLDEHGFVGIEVEDLSATFVQQYQTIYARLRERRAALIEQFSERVFDIVVEMNGKILAGFEQGHIGGARFVARKDG